MAHTQLTGGGFTDAAGNVLAFGTLVMQLSQDGVLSEGQGQVSGAIKISILLDINGDVSTSPAQYVWPTDELSPAGTTYTAWVYAADGQLAWGPNYNLTVPTGATFNIDNWTPNEGTAPLATLGTLTVQTNGVNNIDQQTLDLLAGSGIELTAGPSGGVTITATAGHPFWFNVTAYGATGNGSTDDTAAIQAAITAALGADGGVIYFPPGTYKIVPPSTSYIFNIGSGHLWFRGDGQGVSVIQVGAGAGDYEVIFGPSANSDANNVTFSDLTIDQNTANNPINGGFNGGIPDRMVIWSNNGTADLTVMNAEFINLGCTNCITSYAQKTTVSGCRFVQNDPGSVYYDCSVLYIVGENSTITGNIFIGVLNGAGSVCAIETHGGKQTVTGNSIYEFWNAMNITGVTEFGDSNTIAVTGNTIYGAYFGIQLWSYKDGAHTTGFGLHDVTVSGNAIRLTQTAWTLQPGDGSANLGDSSGIFVSPDCSLPLQNILISDNVVEFDLEANNSYPYNNAGSGIGYWDATTVNSITGFRVIGNTIVNCPLPGVRFSADGSGVEISGNQIINPGSSLSADSGFQCGMLIANNNNPLLNVRVNNNSIADNISTTRMVNAIELAVEPDSDVVALGNIIVCSGATTTAFSSAFTASSGIDPVVSYTQVNPPVTGANLPVNIGQGSTIIDPQNGKTWAILPNGTNWVAVLYGTAAPSGGSIFFEAGDTVWNSAPTAGGYAGWKCTSSGAPGNWVPILLADSAGNVSLNGQPNGQYLAFRTASLVDRWHILTSDNETGSNAGSDLFINNYADNGAQIGVAVEIVRATGEVLINHGLVIASAAPTVAGGSLGLGATTSATATAGSNGAVPSQVAGYLIINVAGTEFKVPYFPA